ncbi:MAG: carbon storage regulator [Aminipila sp.]
MLILTRKQGEAFLLGENIEISIAEISGDRVRIAINAPKDVKILRKELKDASELNRESVTSMSSEAALINITHLAKIIKEKK